MAKQIGLKITGRIDDYSFYHNRLHGHLVRRTGGVTSNQYQTDDRYAAVRDASTEFASVSKAGKLIRCAFGDYANQVKDGTMVNRLNKELVVLKQADNEHTRGQRRPDTMMGDPEANKWLRIFQLNEEVKVYELMEHFEGIHDTMSRVRTKPFAFPEGATHAGLTLVRSVINFEKGCFETDSSHTVMISRSDAGLELGLDARHRVPRLTGIEVVCLQVVFYEEVNGDYVQLKGKVHGMGIIRVTAFSAIARSLRQSRNLHFKPRSPGSQSFPSARRRTQHFRASSVYQFGKSHQPRSTDTRHENVNSRYLTMETQHIVPTAPT